MSYFDDSKLQDRIAELEDQVKALQSANEALGQANIGLALNYQQAQEKIIQLERKLEFPESDSSVFVPRTWHESMLANVRAQLPPTMQDCTIRFKECEKCRRGYLQPDNWVNHGCPHCARDAMQTTIEVLAKANTDLTGRLTELQRETSDAWLAYAKVSQENERLKHSLASVRPTVHPKQPVHHDDLGPIFKDDLDAGRLRDGVLERSQESRNKILAKHENSGEAGIEFGPDECRRPNCPTKHPHRHLVHPDTRSEPTLEEVLEERRRRIMATLDDEKSQIGDPDVIPKKEPKASPNHVKADMDHRHGALDQLRDSARMVPPQHTINNDAARMAEKFADASGEAGPHAPPENIDGFRVSDETENTPDKKTEER